jgi:hypothetical protein
MRLNRERTRASGANRREAKSAAKRDEERRDRGASC